MDYRERIEDKVNVIFQITNQYLSGQIPVEEAKEQLNGEMVRIRPAQFEAVKVELGKRLRESDSQVKSEKLLELFKNYLSPLYFELESGHPLRNYYEENSKVRACMVRVDEMEGEEVTLEAWTNIYELLSRFKVHVKRQEKNFYPLMIPFGMRLQVEKAKELGEAIISEISKNQEMLKNGDIIDFLFNQRSLTQTLMNYLALEERVLFPKALRSLSNQDFGKLRELDDVEGYVYIEQPENFILKENPSTFLRVEDYYYETETKKEEIGKVSTDVGLLLSTLLAAKDMGIIYYTLSGEILFVMGNQITEMDLHITEETKQVLLNGIKNQRKYWYNQGNQTFLITYSVVMDSFGKYQGILKTKEDISEIKTLTGENLEGQKTEKMDLVVIHENIRKEDRTIDFNQKIAELFIMYPKFQVDFYRLDEELKGLKGPMGMEILKEATVGMLAKSLRIDAGKLLDRINELLESYE